MVSFPKMGRQWNHRDFVQCEKRQSWAVAITLVASGLYFRKTAQLLHRPGVSISHVIAWHWKEKFGHNWPV